uniref:Secreted serine/threonine protein kinase n=1 Tax=uncultured planctomycete 3FN TaxID=455066 RepID=A9LGW3_9BACT|nr:secreted serine/threonine protein kinase [uncultured planctomycete 3FN]
MNRTRLLRACCVTWIVLATVSPTHADEWSRFRGPNGSGVSEATSVPVEWSAKQIRWKQTLPGVGHSSPVIWKDKLFVSSADPDAGKRFLFCFQARDGRELWRKEFPLPKKRRKHRNNSFASSSPAVDAERVYFLQQDKTGSPLTAFDHAGKQLWTYDLGPYSHGQGPATSPIVFEDSVIVSNDHKAGSFLLSVDRRTGKELWKIPRDGKRACFTTPCVYVVEGRPTELIFSHCYEGISGVNPQTGRQNWMLDPFGRSPQRAVVSPFVVGDLIVAGSGAVNGGKVVVAVRPSTSDEKVTAKEVYRLDRGTPHVPTAVAYGRHLYLWSDTGIVSCFEGTTGKKVWQNRVDGTFFSSPICVNGRLYNINLDGDVFVLATGNTFQLLAQNALGEGSRATMAVGDGTLFVHTYSQLIAIGGE